MLSDPCECKNFFLSKSKNKLKKIARCKDWGDIKPDPATTQMGMHREQTEPSRNNPNLS
jgi:hypothetical protein